MYVTKTESLDLMTSVSFEGNTHPNFLHTVTELKYKWLNLYAVRRKLVSRQ